MLDAGDVRHGRMPADGDQDLVGGIGLPGDLDRVRVAYDTAAVDDLDAAIVEHIDVDLRQPADFVVLGGDQARPVEMRRRHGPAEAGGIGKGVGELRAVDQQFLRDAAAQHASAADAQLLADRDTRAITGGTARTRDPARAGADRE